MSKVRFSKESESDLVFLTKPNKSIATGLIEFESLKLENP